MHLLCFWSSIQALVSMALFSAPVYSCVNSTWPMTSWIVDVCMSFREQEFRTRPRIWEWGIARRHQSQGKTVATICSCEATSATPAPHLFPLISLGHQKNSDQLKGRKDRKICNSSTTIVTFTVRLNLCHHIVVGSSYCSGLSSLLVLLRTFKDWKI